LVLLTPFRARYLDVGLAEPHDACQDRVLTPHVTASSPFYLSLVYWSLSVVIMNRWTVSVIALVVLAGLASGAIDADEVTALGRIRTAYPALGSYGYASIYGGRWTGTYSEVCASSVVQYQWYGVSCSLSGPDQGHVNLLRMYVPSIASRPLAHRRLRCTFPPSTSNDPGSASASPKWRGLRFLTHTNFLQMTACSPSQRHSGFGSYLRARGHLGTPICARSVRTERPQIVERVLIFKKSPRIDK
jgi:hypothetical protein